MESASVSTTTEPRRRSIVVNDVIDSARMNAFSVTTFVVCLAAFIWDRFDINVFGLVMPVLMKDLKLTPAQAGLLASYGMAGMIYISA